VRIDLRWGGGDINRMRALAQELVGLQPDIILTNGATPATVAVLRETRTIPIVFANLIDPPPPPRWQASGLSCSRRSRPRSSGPQSCSILISRPHRL
jgi:hypothetical protein